MSSFAAIESSSTTTLLGITFIVLKLTHVIAWSWVWVLAPFWLPLALALFLFGVFLILAVGAHLITLGSERR